MPAKHITKVSVHNCQERCIWLTPKSIIEKSIQVLGKIDLDPCSNSHESPNVPALKHYTAEDDGLFKPWEGTVFLNPPWSRKEGISFRPWVKKLHECYMEGSVTSALALLPACTEQAWFQDDYASYTLCLLRGRVKFNEGKKRAPFASLIVYLGTNSKLFCEKFQDLGCLYLPWLKL